MKKALTALIAIGTIMIFSKSMVHAELIPKNFIETENQERFETSDVYEISDYKDFDDISEFLEAFAEKWFANTGKRIVWAICSLNNHKNVQFHIFYGDDEERYDELIRSECDFIQVGGIKDIAFLQLAKEAIEEDEIKSALSAIASSSLLYDKEKCADIISNNIPVYFEINESEKYFSLQVAIGKYEIKQGDTLSEIAVMYQTTVEELLRQNSNISNPDLIYAGDYLVIK